MASSKKSKTTSNVITPEKIEQAKAGRFFLKAVGTGTLRLTGAVDRGTMWAETPAMAYNVWYRVAGTPAQIREALARGGLSDEDIETTMAQDLITSSNYQTTMREVYEEEIEAAKQFKKVVKAPEFTLSDLRSALEILDIKPGTITASVPTGDEGAKTQAKGGRKAATGKAAPAKKKTQDLLKRLQGLAQGAVLDVSKMDENGNGARSRQPPQTDKSARVSVPGGPAVISNNYATYKAAMDMLGPDYAKYAQQYADMYGTGEKATVRRRETLTPRGRPTSPRQASPARERSQSPTGAARRPMASMKRTAPPASRTTEQPAVATPQRSASPPRAAAKSAAVPGKRVGVPTRPGQARSPGGQGGRASNLSNIMGARPGAQ